MTEGGGAGSRVVGVLGGVVGEPEPDPAPPADVPPEPVPEDEVAEDEVAEDEVPEDVPAAPDEDDAAPDVDAVERPLVLLLTAAVPEVKIPGAPIPEARVPFGAD